MVNVAAFYEGEDDRSRARGLGRGVRAGSGRATTARTSTSWRTKATERVRAAYPGATWDRLAAIKRRYDPENLFRRNQNVPPSPA